MRRRVELAVSPTEIQLPQGELRANEQTTMNRRDFINRSATASLGVGLAKRLLGESFLNESAVSGHNKTDAVSEKNLAPVLPGTSPLTVEGDLALLMVDGIHRHLLREAERQPIERSPRWNRDSSSPDRHALSVEPNRSRFLQIIGAVDPRVAAQAPELVVTVTRPTEIAQDGEFTVSRVRWHVLAAPTADSDELNAEGLLLLPKGDTLARVVAIPDADCTPEMLTGLISGISPTAQFARRLAENGCEVIVPTLINRADTFSGIPDIGMTNMPHREWIYRMAFEVGRHVIGYEVQKVLAAVDWFEVENQTGKLPIGLVGYGEGGLLALYSSAVDTRINATLVSGYFQSREEVWKEPIYRDIWGLLREFGDAELASLLAPRTLIVEACGGPEISGPPHATEEHKPYACPNGRLGTPALENVQAEFERARPFFIELGAGDKLQLVTSGGGHGLPGSEKALEAFFRSVGIRGEIQSPGRAPIPTSTYDTEARLHRQFNQMVCFTQALIRKSPDRRKDFWTKADSSSVHLWESTSRFYRDYIWDEIIGRVSSPLLAPNPRTRLILDEPGFTGYEVMLDVWQDVFASGILLLPKHLKPGERRPVVVCQHGLEARPMDVAYPRIDDPAYHHFAASLAERGFITYAPQNPYTGLDKFRLIQRMGHPLKLAIFSFILGQHEQLLNWLCAQTYIDPDRIGFYGLSYGGKTAVRVPPLLDRYALSICSGDFNDWVWKTTNVLAPQSYLLTKEYDMYEFNLANIINYSDLASLMAPRPFMVERGHDDPVGIDERVSYEYAAVRRFYDKLGISDKIEIEFFNGPHTIHGVKTFEFLEKHLKWKT
jgi:dienelactone hydrolase